jgi:hypothetical protein
MSKVEEVEISALVGKTIKQITGLEEGSEKVNIYTECGEHYIFHHKQDCCEQVTIIDFDADVEELVGGHIVSAEEVSNSHDEYDGSDKPYTCSESWTWTFYKIETNKGGIFMRWLGESNGYYSESVDLFRLIDKSN